MFILGFSTYWKYNGVGNEVVKLILLCFPSAFVISLVLNQMRVDHEIFDDDQSNCEFATRETNRLLALPACQLRIFHFIPLLREMLFLSHPNRHDIEAMFRMNTLSSFCLGVAQLIGAGFYVGVGGGAMSLEITLNLTTVILNWLITVMYYLTPIARVMSDAVSAENFADDIHDKMKKDFDWWLAAIEEANVIQAREHAHRRFSDSEGDYHVGIGSDHDSHSDPDFDLEDLDLDVPVSDQDGAATYMSKPAGVGQLTAANLATRKFPELAEVNKYRKKVEEEIHLLCNVLVDLQHLPMDTLIKFRMQLFKKHLNLFSAL
jgi:hypothetical protein